MKVVVPVIAVVFFCILALALIGNFTTPAPADRQSAESFKSPEQQRKDRIYLKAYDECKETKVSADAISRCILQKTN
jgi:hypothetical protein